MITFVLNKSKTMNIYKVKILLTEGEDTFRSVKEIVNKYGVFKGVTLHNLNYHFNKLIKDKDTGELVKNTNVNIGGLHIEKIVIN